MHAHRDADRAEFIETDRRIKMRVFIYRAVPPAGKIAETKHKKTSDKIVADFRLNSSPVSSAFLGHSSRGTIHVPPSNITQS
jgi:hypothetical protein